MGQVIDIRMALFARRVAEIAPGPVRVQLERWFEPEVIAFSRATPDRIYAGQIAFDALRARGFEEVARPCTPGGALTLANEPSPMLDLQRAIRRVDDATRGLPW